MRFLFTFAWFFLSLAASSQNEQLAQNYFDRGEFEKAKLIYEELHKGQPSNSVYFQRMVESNQQLEKFDVAEKLLTERFVKYKQAGLLVELGYNLQLKKNEEGARKKYEEALERIQVNPSEAYTVGPGFEKRSLLDYALRAYQIAREKEPRMNFNFQTALIYGQQGKTDLMINTFLDEAYTNQQNAIIIQNRLSRFMMEDGSPEFAETLRKALLVRAQKDQDVFWNQYLSWFYVQQKEYGKAFIQEKSIYRRNPESLSNILNLAQLSVQEGDVESARDIYGFVLENSQELDLRVNANYHLMKIRIASATEKDNAQIESDMNSLMQEFGSNPQTVSLQLLQAHFATFNANNPEKGKQIIQEALKLNLNRYQQADLKMELADIFLYEQKFNQALLYYSQIEDELKNDAVGHQASLKAAKTSYFKGDFDWAQQQFTTLKSASTQLIANDALEYFLLINDNSVADTTKVALSEFAKADYLVYQNKIAAAKQQFIGILSRFKGNEIEAVTELRLGRIEERQGDYLSALSRYKNIMENHADGIYVDEAMYFSALVYADKLSEPEKAKPLLEKVIFEHPDSIYFVEARTKYRLLRGDGNL